MAIVYDKLMALQIAPAEQAYEAKDCMLYALGIGLGHDPMNEDELAFVYEKDSEGAADHGDRAGHSGFARARSR
jgi:phage terminase small subunit